MAYTTVNKSSLYQSNLLYTGNNTGQSITGVGFQPDFIWNKARTNTETHNIWDVVRGVGKGLVPSNAGGEQNWSTGVTSFDSDGWTMGVLDSMNDGSVPYASWNWKAGGTGSANTDGSINSTVSASTTSGFSIVKWTGSGANATIGHGLGKVPTMIIVKNLSSYNWNVYSVGLGATKNLVLNEAEDTETQSYWQDTTPTSSVFYVNSNSNVNQSSTQMIAYCFADIQGYSKVGAKYVGTGNTDGRFIYTGFAPKFVMTTCVSANGSWWMRGDKIATYNIRSKVIIANTDSAETNGVAQMDFLNNGFKLKDTTDASNGDNKEYIYMAFGQSLIGSNNVINTAVHSSDNSPT